MKKGFRQTLIFRVIFYIGATAVVLFVAQFQKHMTGNWIEPLVTNLDAGQSKELDAFLEMNRLITTLDTTLLGAMGFILANGRKTQRSGTTMWIAFASAFCVFLSLLWLPRLSRSFGHAQRSILRSRLSGDVMGKPCPFLYLLAGRCVICGLCFPRSSER